MKTTSLCESWFHRTKPEKLKKGYKTMNGLKTIANMIAVRNTPDILLHLMKTKRLTKAECKESLQKLVDCKRLSEKTKKTYEKAGGL